jgi:hypothetical protein
MADEKMSIYSLLEAQMANEDYIPFLDVSDNAQSVNGSTRRALLKYLRPATIIISPSGSNDTSLVQLAEDYINNLGGGSLYFKKGSYRFNSSVRTYSNIEHIAEKGVVINLYGGSNAFVIGNNGTPNTGSATADPADTYQNISFYGFEFNLQGKTASALGMYCVKNLRIERNYIHNSGGYGVYIINCSDVWVQDNIIGDLIAAGTYACVQFKGVVRGWIVNNHLYNACQGAGNQGIDSHPSSDVYARNGENNHYIGNYVEQCAQGINCEDNNSEILANTILNTKGGTGGITLIGTPTNVIIESNIIDGAQTASMPGITLKYATIGTKNIKIANNIIKNMTGYGIYAFPDDTTADCVIDLRIIGNAIQDNGNSGIFSSSKLRGLVIRHNKIKNSAAGTHGVFCRTNNAIISDNQIFDDQPVATQQDGIIIDGASGCEIRNNRIYNNTLNQIHLTTGTQSGTIIENNTLLGGTRGLKFDNSSNDNSKITGNYFANSSSSAISISGSSVGSNVMLRNNYGYITENSGTATIPSSSTSVVVTHGLSKTPTLKDIAVIIGANPTNDPGNIWVDTITSTQFTINCRNNPGASNLSLAWKAIML